MATIDFTALQNEVDANDTVDGSAIALINGLAAQVEELKAQVAGMDPVAIQNQLQAFADRLRASRENLTLAVTNNTSVQSAPPSVSGGTAGVDQLQAEQRARAAQGADQPPIGGTPRE